MIDDIKINMFLKPKSLQFKLFSSPNASDQKGEEMGRKILTNNHAFLNDPVCKN